MADILSIIPIITTSILVIERVLYYSITHIRRSRCADCCCNCSFSTDDDGKVEEGGKGKISYNQ